jgi:O-antigen ligase
MALSSIKKELFFSRIKTALLLAVSATLPTRWVNLNSYFIILLLVVWLVDVIESKKKINYSLMVLLSFTSFFFLTLISILYSANLVPLLSKLETRLAILGLPLALLGSLNVEKKIFNLVLKTFLTSSILVSLLCIIYTFSKNYINGESYHVYNNWLFSSDNLVEKFGFHPNYFSIYCAFDVFIIIHFFKEKKIRLWTSIVLIIYLSFVLLLLASRIGIITFVFLFILTVTYETYRRKKLIVGGLIIFIFLSVTLVVGLNSQTVMFKFDALFNRNIQQYNEPFRVNRRITQWKLAIELYLKSPFIGVGTGDMQDELQKLYIKENFIEGYESQFNPHNLFLDSAASLGILGVASNFILFSISFCLAFYRRNILYLQFLILFLAISMVESTFSVQKGVVFFFFFNSLFYSTLSQDTPNKC